VSSDEQKMSGNSILASKYFLAVAVVCYFFCESLPCCLAAWQEVCAMAVCWPVGWEDGADLWAHRGTGITLCQEIWMVTSCGTHADTLAQCWMHAPGRSAASRCLSAA